MITDDRAIHIAFLAASVSSTGTTAEQQSARKRASAVVKQIALETADTQVFSDVAQRYRQTFVSSLDGPAVADDVYEQARLNRVWSAYAELQTRFGPAAIVKFRNFVDDTKKHVRLIPIPNMQRHVGSLWERLFERPVYAQMGYYATTSTTVVGDTDANDTGTFMRTE